MSKVATAEVCLEGVAPRYSVKSLWIALSESLSKLRCRLLHKSVSMPVKGKYRCWTCLREFDTTW